VAIPEVILSFGALQEDEFSMQIPRVHCEKCDATGRVAGTSCEKCHGHGYYIPTKSSSDEATAKDALRDPEGESRRP
jgi:hypothetical protein